MRILICAAGTGGHIFPGVSVAQEISKKYPKAKILFLTSSKQVESYIAKKIGFKVKMMRMRGLGLARVFFEMIKFSPDAVFSTGGYMSFPAGISSWLLRKKFVLHEQNVLPGKGVRISSFFASKVAVSVKESRKYFRKGKAVFTGNPVREKVRETLKEKAVNALEIDPSKKTVLITGGSQGAVSLNSCVMAMLDLLQDQPLNILHITGKKDYGRVCKTELPSNTSTLRYKCFPFLDNIWDALCAADLVISRAGATMISEIACKKLPSILVPYPYSAEGHQKLNAKELEHRGAAVVVSDDSLDPKNMADMIVKLLGDEKKLEHMAHAAGTFYEPDAAEKITEILLEDL
jgi:UDP-N-acetylglucosamine--N-acetylmuramyl-(pentapeptide) pyrophosphoryl-undecaprenol N-acetylglucosamine transferase